jgi:hypothetical protein
MREVMPLGAVSTLGVRDNTAAMRVVKETIMGMLVVSRFKSDDSMRSIYIVWLSMIRSEIARITHGDAEQARVIHFSSC